MPRRTVSMLTEIMAKEGTEFSPYASAKCLKCRFFNVCIGNLRPAARYKVVKVRFHKNKCPLLREEMYVVEIEELPVRLVIDTRLAVPGMTIRYNLPANCVDEKVRKYNVKCEPPYIIEGEKILVKKIIAKLDGGLTVVEAEILEPPSQELWYRIFPQSVPRTGLRRGSRRFSRSRKAVQ